MMYTDKHTSIKVIILDWIRMNDSFITKKYVNGTSILNKNFYDFVSTDNSQKMMLLKLRSTGF